jgi:hypothetical protein
VANLRPRQAEPAGPQTSEHSAGRTATTPGSEQIVTFRNQDAFPDD